MAKAKRKEIIIPIPKKFKTKAFNKLPSREQIRQEEKYIKNFEIRFKKKMNKGRK